MLLGARCCVPCILLLLVAASFVIDTARRSLQPDVAHPVVNLTPPTVTSRSVESTPVIIPQQFSISAHAWDSSNTRSQEYFSWSGGGVHGATEASTNLFLNQWHVDMLNRSDGIYDIVDASTGQCRSRGKGSGRPKFREYFLKIASQLKNKDCHHAMDAGRLLMCHAWAAVHLATADKMSPRCSTITHYRRCAVCLWRATFGKEEPTALRSTQHTSRQCSTRRLQCHRQRRSRQILQDVVH
jgi:hypothetical protein